MGKIKDKDKKGEERFDKSGCKKKGKKNEEENERKKGKKKKKRKIKKMRKCFGQQQPRATEGKSEWREREKLEIMEYR